MTHTRHLLRQLLELTSDSRGVALPMMGLLLLALVAVTGLVIDDGHLYFQGRRIQIAAEGGAYSGAMELRRDNNTRIDREGKYIAHRNGYTHGVDTVDAVTFLPGLYFIQGLKIVGGGPIVAEGVTLYNMGASGLNAHTVDITGNATSVRFVVPSAADTSDFTSKPTPISCDLAATPGSCSDGSCSLPTVYVRVDILHDFKSLGPCPCIPELTRVRRDAFMRVQ